VRELRVEDAVRLTREVGAPRLSLFLPLRPGSSRATKLRQSATNALLRADRALRAAEESGVAGARLLDLVERALDQPRRTGPDHRGLAVFADPTGVRQYHLPVPVPPVAVVGERFTITPALPAIGGQAEFFLLSLDPDEIRLFRGTRRAVERVELTGRELAAWTTLPRPRPVPVLASLGDRAGAAASAVVDGHDDGSAERRSQLLEHFRGVDRALREMLAPRRAPLVLAGPEPLQAMYRAVNTYPHLALTGVDDHPARSIDAELHRRGWAIAEPELRRLRQAAIQRYRELRGTDRAVVGVADVHSAAAAGRVESILIDRSALARGRLDESLDRAVVETLSRAGSVLVVPSAEMPEQSPVVAVLRPSRSAAPSDAMVETSEEVDRADQR
jgi:hypothetical protein